MNTFKSPQSAGVPDKVSVYTSQLTPSTQVLSSVEPPATAVPTQVSSGPVGPIVPEPGSADCTCVVENANTTKTMAARNKSVPRVARAEIEEEVVLFMM